MENSLAYSKLSKLPAELQSEVMDFIDFLLSKEKKKEPVQKPKFGSAKGMFKMKPDTEDKQKLSEKFGGKLNLTEKEYTEFQQHLTDARNEWESNF